jgi:sugar O-acyltransferase (sialic acid O-acetyltransferase NeuD family)
MSKEKILLIGAGGHSQSCIDVIQQENKYEIVGLIGIKEEVGQNRLGYEILGTDEDLLDLSQSISNVLIAVGQIKSAVLRKKLFNLAQNLNFKTPSIISPKAYVSPHAKIGAGTILMHGTYVNAGATVGENCIINSRALVEHGANIGDHCHLSTGAIVNGNVSIGDKTFVGSGSVIKEGIIVGENCVIGMGLSLFTNLNEGITFLGEGRN